jgi:hypothetical protein
VTVLNGTLTNGLAAGAAAQLTSRGFTVVGQPADAATSDYTQSVIQYGQASDRAAAETLASQIAGAEVQQATGVTPGTVRLILGSTFTSVAAAGSVKSKPATDKPLGTIAGSYKASSPCRNSAFFGPNLPKPSGRVSCAC